MTRSLAAVGGPALAGACLGFPAGAAVLLHHAVALPLVIAAAAVLMAPALYIGVSFAGATLTVSELAHATLDALADAGIVLAGLSPAVLFLIATSEGAGVVTPLAYAVVATAILLAVRAFFRRLVTETTSTGARVVLAAWSLVALSIGERFFHAALVSGGAA